MPYRTASPPVQRRHAWPLGDLIVAATFGALLAFSMGSLMWAAFV